MSGDHSGVGRRTFMKYAGATGAVASVAGCSDLAGGTDTATDRGPTGEDTPVPAEPSTREEYLQKANSIAAIKAPWIYLNRQYSVYGVNSDLDWTARRDELIAAREISGVSDVTITQGQMDSGLDPHDHRETPTDNIMAQAYEGLLRRDPEGAIIEGLATGYERQENGRVRFTIREGVSFHNGDDLTKRDVAFSINRIVQEDVGNLASSQRTQLAGVDEARTVDGQRAVEVLSMEDGELAVNPIVFNLFASFCDVMQRDWVLDNSTSDDRSYLNTHMNGTGPFQLVNYEQDTVVEFEGFDDHWEGSPDVNSLTYNAAPESSTRVNRLLNDESDIVVNVPPQEASRVEDNSGTEIKAVPSTRVIFNAMRYDVEPFDDPKFRRAMNYAIDIQGIIDNVLGGFADPTGQPTLEGFVGYNDAHGPYPQDQDFAEDLVDESGYDGAEIELHTPVGRYLKDAEIAQAVANQIDQLSNVSASVNQREFASLVQELVTGNIEDKPQWYLIGWGNSTFDASQTLIPLLTTGTTFSTWSNEDFDEAVEQAGSMVPES